MKKRLIILALMLLLMGLVVGDITANIRAVSAGRGDFILFDFFQSFHGGSEEIEIS